MYTVIVGRLNYFDVQIIRTSELCHALVYHPEHDLFEGRPFWGAFSKSMFHILKRNYQEDTEVKFIEDYRKSYPIRILLQAVDIYKNIGDDSARFIYEFAQACVPDVTLALGTIDGPEHGGKVHVIYEVSNVNLPFLEACFTNKVLTVSVYEPTCERIVETTIAEQTWDRLCSGQSFEIDGREVNFHTLFALPQNAQVKLIDKRLDETHNASLWPSITGR